jgi:hypothetical protein
MSSKISLDKARKQILMLNMAEKKPSKKKSKGKKW